MCNKIFKLLYVTTTCTVRNYVSTDLTIYHAQLQIFRNTDLYLEILILII